MKTAHEITKDLLNYAIELDEKAKLCNGEGKSFHQMHANVWRAAASVADKDYVLKYYKP
jgi:hypothetical protein